MHPLQLLYHGKNTFETPSKLDLSESHRQLWHTGITLPYSFDDEESYMD